MLKQSILCIVCMFAIGCVWEETSHSQSYIPCDDSNFPYAGIPRVVIETEDLSQIRDVETYIPAQMQIYGKNGPESDVMFIQIRGRGNSSFTSPKFGYKLKFGESMPIFSLPSGKNWVLLPNYVDKSLLRNTMAFKMGEKLGEPWVPQYRYVELFINRDYKGVYQWTENILVHKNRLNLMSDEYLLEVDRKYRESEQVVFSKDGVPFRIHHPKDLSMEELDSVEKSLGGLESFLKEKPSIEEIAKRIDLDAYIRYYWIQEFSKNVDGNFNTSVFFVWNLENPVKMGPLWDYDAAYGAMYERDYEGWYIRGAYWNHYLFANEDFLKKTRDFWKENRYTIRGVIDSLPTYGRQLRLAAKNNFDRWPILKEDEILGSSITVYNNYDEAVKNLQNWMYARWNWISGEIP